MPKSRVIGVRRLRKQLGELESAFVSRAARALYFQAAGVVQKNVQAEARNSVGQVTGNLVRSIERGVFPTRNRKRVAAFVRSNPRVAFYAPFVNFGTATRQTRARGTGRRVSRGQVTANPFFDRGVNRSRRPVQQALRVGLEKIIARQVQKSAPLG